MTAPAPIILNFKSMERNSLRGFFDLELASGMILNGCMLHTKDGHRWIGLPSRPWSKEDGTQSYAKIIGFKDKATAERFQNIVTPLAVAAYERTREAAA
jgi:hypothetical protein